VKNRGVPYFQVFNIFLPGVFRELERGPGEGRWFLEKGKDNVKGLKIFFKGGPAPDFNLFRSSSSVLNLKSILFSRAMSIRVEGRTEPSRWQ